MQTLFNLATNNYCTLHPVQTISCTYYKWFLNQGLNKSRNFLALGVFYSLFIISGPFPLSRVTEAKGRNSSEAVDTNRPSEEQRCCGPCRKHAHRDRPHFLGWAGVFQIPNPRRAGSHYTRLVFMHHVEGSSMTLSTCRVQVLILCIF